MIEELEHTADAGIRVTADNLPDFFVEAAWAMLGLILDDKPEFAVRKIELKLKADDIDALLMKFLTESYISCKIDLTIPKKFGLCGYQKNRTHAVSRRFSRSPTTRP